MNKPYLELNNISKHFSGTYVLKNVDLSVHEGEALALLGANGAGKSTLMNILGGIVAPTEGEILIGSEPADIKNASDAERMGIGFIHQELALCPTMTAAENIFISRFPIKNGMINAGFMASESRRILKQLGCRLDVQKEIRQLGAGDKQLVEIGRVLLSDAKIIIFDEPTSSLAIKEKERFFEIIRSLKRQKKVIIYITHFLDEIFHICDQVQVLRNGKTAGGGRIQDFDHHDLVNLMVGDISIDTTKKPTRGNSEVVMRASGFRRSGVLDDISFELHKGEILGLWGLMGSGRTELVRALTGLDRVESGRIEINISGAMKETTPGKLLKRVGLVTENRREDGLFLSLSVRENISSANLKFLLSGGGLTIDKKKEEQNAGMQVKDLNIKLQGIEQIISTLSGGNQQKVILARWLSKTPDILLMDEPTRGVDVGAKSEIHRIIKKLSGEGFSILVISSEIEEIMELSHRYMVIRGGKIVKELPGEASEEDLMLWAARAEKEESNPA